MKIQDLSKLNVNDIKKLDLAKIQEDILAKPDIAINVGLVLLSLFVMFQIFNGKQTEIGTLKSEIEDWEKKTAVVDTVNATQKQLADYIKNLPQGLLEDKVIGNLADFAESRKVQIISFSPIQIEHKKYFDKVAVNVSITSDDYKNICLFVSDIENSPYALRLQKWIGSMEENKSGDLTIKTKIDAQLTVESINFKNEQK